MAPQGSDATGGVFTVQARAGGGAVNDVPSDATTAYAHRHQNLTWAAHTSPLRPTRHRSGCTTPSQAPPSPGCADSRGSTTWTACPTETSRSPGSELAPETTARRRRPDGLAGTDPSRSPSATPGPSVRARRRPSLSRRRRTSRDPRRGCGAGRPVGRPLRDQVDQLAGVALPARQVRPVRTPDQPVRPRRDERGPTAT
jgi:hypothetical protein